MTHQPITLPTSKLQQPANSALLKRLKQNSYYIIGQLSVAGQAHLFEDGAGHSQHRPECQGWEFRYRRELPSVVGIYRYLSHNHTNTQPGDTQLTNNSNSIKQDPCKYQLICKYLVRIKNQHKYQECHQNKQYLNKTLNKVIVSYDSLDKIHQLITQNQFKAQQINQCNILGIKSSSYPIHNFINNYVRVINSVKGNGKYVQKNGLIYSRIKQGTLKKNNTLKHRKEQVVKKFGLDLNYKDKIRKNRKSKRKNEQMSDQSKIKSSSQSSIQSIQQIDKQKFKYLSDKLNKNRKININNWNPTQNKLSNQKKQNASIRKKLLIVPGSQDSNDSQEQFNQIQNQRMVKNRLQSVEANHNFSRQQSDQNLNLSKTKNKQKNDPKEINKTKSIKKQKSNNKSKSKIKLKPYPKIRNQLQIQAQILKQKQEQLQMKVKRQNQKGKKGRNKRNKKNTNKKNKSKEESSSENGQLISIQQAENSEQISNKKNKEDSNIQNDNQRQSSKDLDNRQRKKRSSIQDSSYRTQQIKRITLDDVQDGKNNNKIKQLMNKKIGVEDDIDIISKIGIIKEDSVNQNIGSQKLRQQKQKTQAIQDNSKINIVSNKHIPLLDKINKKTSIINYDKNKTQNIDENRQSYKKQQMQILENLQLSSNASRMHTNSINLSQQIKQNSQTNALSKLPEHTQNQQQINKPSNSNSQYSIFQNHKNYSGDRSQQRQMQHSKDKHNTGKSKPKVSKKNVAPPNNTTLDQFFKKK